MKQATIRKIPEERSFYFYSGIGNYTGQRAASLEEFLEKVKTIDAETLEFHLQRRDFEKWFKEVWGLELSDEMSKIRKLSPKGEALRTRLYDTMSRSLRTSNPRML